MEQHFKENWESRHTTKSTPHFWPENKDINCKENNTFDLGINRSSLAAKWLVVELPMTTRSWDMSFFIYQLMRNTLYLLLFQELGTQKSAFVIPTSATTAAAVEPRKFWFPWWPSPSLASPCYAFVANASEKRASLLKKAYHQIFRGESTKAIYLQWFSKIKGLQLRGKVNDILRCKHWW